MCNQNQDEGIDLFPHTLNEQSSIILVNNIIATIFHNRPGAQTQTHGVLVAGKVL